MITSHEKDNILHVIYSSSIDEIPADLLSICDAYEGPIKGRVGCNFPMSFVREKKHTSAFLNQIQTPSTEYVIIYKKSDILTKQHELQHANYALQPVHRDAVLTLWNSLHPSCQQRIQGMLRKMGYPDHVLLDEFQAYYYTERTLFGKLDTIQRVDQSNRRHPPRAQSK